MSSPAHPSLQTAYSRAAFHNLSITQPVKKSHFVDPKWWLPSSKESVNGPCP